MDVDSGVPRCSIRLLSTLRIKDKPNQLNILSSWKHSLVHKRLHTYSCRNITHTNISNYTHTHNHSHSHTDRRSSQNSKGKTNSSSMNTKSNRQKFPLATISNCFSHKLELELELKLQ
uniref:GEO04174p1 n=1 Tax=Drosophila melanogaster TaxID=7227 RepID=Q7K2S6_DROME